MSEDKVKATTKELTTEMTGTQSVSGVVSNFFAEMRGFSPAPNGDYSVYRAMRNNPTVAMARIAATAPIRSAEIGIESKDNTPEDRTEFITAEVDRLWPALIKDCLWSLDFGFQSFEKVYEIKDGRYSLKKLKPLKPDDTKLVLDVNTNTFLGIKQSAIELPAEKVFWLVYDGEPGDWYGRPRHENIRTNAWHPWQELIKKMGQFSTKVSSVIPMIEYPLGESRDKAGDIKSNYELATAVLQSLGDGKGVAMPNVFSSHAQDLARSGVNLNELKAWHISFLETKGSHGKELVDMMRHFESLIMRGWLVPERAVLEGQYGTKAEAGVHANMGLLIADLVLADFIDAINRFVVNPLLMLNYGKESEGSVYISHIASDEATQLFFRGIMDKVLTAPGNVQLLIEMLDIDTMLDLVGLPKSEEVVNPRAPIKDPGEPPSDDAVDIMQQLYRQLNG